MNGRSCSAGDVDDPGQLRVRRRHHLEPPVEQEAVEGIGAGPSPGHVGRLEHVDVAPGPGEVVGRGKARQAGADHHDVGACGEAVGRSGRGTHLCIIAAVA